MTTCTVMVWKLSMKLPFPAIRFLPKEFIGDWNNTMARYNLQPVAFDGFLDTMRFRDHVLNHRESFRTAEAGSAACP